MKKLLLVISILTILVGNALAIDLTTHGIYLGEAVDAHMVVIQGELYTLDKRENTRWLAIMPGSTVVLRFTLNDDGKVVGIKIIEADWELK